MLEGVTGQPDDSPDEPEPRREEEAIKFDEILGEAEREALRNLSVLRALQELSEL
jgi:hypothetical protein